MKASDIPAAAVDFDALNKQMVEGVPELVKQDAALKPQFDRDEGIFFDPKWQDDIADFD